MWQEFEHSKATVYLYSAHLDNRAYTHKTPLIRIFAAADINYHGYAFKCQIWFEGQEYPEISKVEAGDYLGFADYVVPQKDDANTPHSIMYVKARQCINACLLYTSDAADE